MSKFLASGEVIHPQLVFTLPEEKRPDKLMYHGVHHPMTGETHPVCVVHPNGEVKIFPLHSRREDVLSALARDYGIEFEQLRGISWENDDADAG